MPSRRVLGSLVILLGAIGTAALARPGGAGVARQEPDPLLAARTKGSASAPVTVYEMSDFQCPFCRRQAVETFPTLERDFIATGKVRWVFINFPLTSIHPNAAAAAEFAMCAAKVDKFWPIHDLLFKYQDKWAPLKEPGAFLLTLADSAGIQRSDLTACLEKGETRALVMADADGATKAGAGSTPSFYIEGGLLAGAAPVAAFEQVLDSIWKAKTAK
ncbi:MAG: thioredoxin domain-containing protein [Gemmatimonadota bacterium]